MRPTPCGVACLDQCRRCQRTASVVETAGTPAKLAAEGGLPGARGEATVPTAVHVLASLHEIPSRGLGTPVTDSLQRLPFQTDALESPPTATQATADGHEIWSQAWSAA
jgi:hypothetical protein